MKKIKIVATILICMFSLFGCSGLDDENNSESILESSHAMIDSSQGMVSEDGENTPPTTPSEPVDEKKNNDANTIIHPTIVDNSGNATEESIELALSLPEGWTMDENKIYTDDSMIAEMTSAYVKNSDTPSIIGNKHSGAIDEQELTLGNHTSVYYHMQSTRETGGFINELYYYLNIDDYVVCVVFHPLGGMGGISTQRENFEKTIGTLEFTES